MAANGIFGHNNNEDDLIAAVSGNLQNRNWLCHLIKSQCHSSQRFPTVTNRLYRHLLRSRGNTSDVGMRACFRYSSKRKTAIASKRFDNHHQAGPS